MPSFTASSKSLYAHDFHSLTVRDLLDARDQFHVHLAHKPNVFSTAIGMYLIRDFDPESSHGAGAGITDKRSQKAAPRTLQNSAVRDKSWPCILVFVNQWATLASLHEHPEQVIPPFVYLTDGRMVPICVVLATSANLPARTIPPTRMMDGNLGVGSPIFVEAQGMRRMGTAACMVSDGSDFYILTNAHLAGQRGRDVRALFRGIPTLVGTTQGTRDLTEKTFSDIYPELPGRDSVVNIDAAIVLLNDVQTWNIKAIPQPLGQVADFSAETVSLSWIGLPVVGHGAASGEMRGEIKALFYRYKSIGGRDYVADFVIGSKHDAKELLMTQPGDSGSLWCLDSILESGTLSPVAMEWGGQRISSGDATGQYMQLSLATSIAVTLRELSLDIIQDPTAERTQYWGPVGHFKIGQQACFQVANKALQQFFINNINIVSFSSDATLQTATGMQAKAGFVPLSDVPDVVWKTNINHGKPAVARAMENWNHYADIDLPGADGKTLLDMFEADENSLDWQQWTDFYGNAPHPSASTSKAMAAGALPFRVWQIVAKLLDYVLETGNGAGANFLTAAGCLAHYVGDACQPLHSSQHSDGLNGASTGVHSTYEDNMVDAYATQISDGLADALKSIKLVPREIKNSWDAAAAVMDLMKYCHELLPPETICNVYNEARTGTGKSATKNPDVLKALWDQTGVATIECIAAGAVTLAAIWNAVWIIAKPGTSVGWLKTTFVGEPDIRTIYEAKDFLPSVHLPYFGRADLPDSNAPDPAKPLPAQKSETKPAARKVVAKKAKR